MKATILYVEDDSDLGNVTKQYLEMMDFDVTWCQSGNAAYEAYVRNNFNLVVIDVGLPDIDGFSLAQRILEGDRGAYFLFLTARKLKQDKIHGLKLGAIDYITKPFDIDELNLRIKNIVARQQPLDLNRSPKQTKIIRVNEICLDLETLSLSIGSAYGAKLTMREAELFTYFCKNPNKIVTREDLLVHIWGENDYFLGRSLDVFVSRLRKLISKSNNVKIENVYGVGFKMVTC